jgi:hypothetical protein
MRSGSASKAAPKRQLFARQQLLANNSVFGGLSAGRNFNALAVRGCSPLEEWALLDLERMKR